MKFRTLIISILVAFIISISITCSKPEPDPLPDKPTSEVPLNPEDVPVRISGKAVRSTIVGYMSSIEDLMTRQNFVIVGINGSENMVSTDGNHYFLFENDYMNEDATVVMLRNSYEQVSFPISYPMLIQKDRIHYINKIMVPNNLSYVNTQETAYFENSTSIGGIGIKTEKNAWLSSGRPWSGNIQIRLLLLHNKTSHLVDFQPGDMRGVNKNGDTVYIHPYLMTGITTVTENIYIGGEVAPGKQISLHVPIPQQSQGIANSAAQTWMYDKKAAVWRELGLAVRNGNYYDMSVSGTGMFAIASSTPLVYFHARLLNRQGDALFHTQVTLIPHDKTGWPISIYTDNMGEFATYIPASEMFTLRARDVCSGYSDSIVIGPLTANTWTTRTMPLDRGPMTIMEGEIVDCDNLPMKSGDILVKFRNMQLRAPIKDGKYSLKFSYCEPAPVSYSFYDSSLSMINSDERKVKLKPGVVNKLPADTVCKSRIKYLKGDIIFNVDGQTYQLNGDIDRIYIEQLVDPLTHKPSTYMYATSTQMRKVLGFSFSSYLKGNYSLYTLVASTPSIPNYIMAWGYYSSGRIDVTNVDFRTGVLVGTFNSRISRESTEEGFKNPTTITGTFNLRAKN